MHMRRLFLRTLGALVALLIAPASWSAALTWTLDGVTFHDGATATGTFDYDAVTSTYSNIDITVTGFVNSQVYGALDSDPYTYNSPDILPQSTSDLLVFVEQISTPDASSDCFGYCRRTMLISFESNLTSLGGTIAVDLNVLSFERLEAVFNNDEHIIIGGAVSAVAVPVPAAAWLFGTALGILGWSGRKRALTKT